MNEHTTIVPDVEDERPDNLGSRTKRGGLFVTDAELIEKLNVPENIMRQVLHMLDADKNWGFPQKSKIFGRRRYWPAVQAWLDEHFGLKVDASTNRRFTNAR